MRVVLINPNSTASMTEEMVAAARRAAPGLRFEGWTSEAGPPAIQGAEDGALATPPLLRLVAQAAQADAGGIIIGCFDDTALAEAAALADCPVIGLGQACYHYAALRHWRFSVVTTLPVSVPVLEANIAAQGLGQHLGRVRAADVPVLDLETDTARATQRVVDEAMRAEAEDGIAALVLGCGGMVHVVEAVRKSVGVHVIDPVACAASCFQWRGAG